LLRRSSCSAFSLGPEHRTSAVRAMAGNAPRHLRQFWRFIICNLQNLQGLTEFESHPLRQLPHARSVVGGSGGLIGHRATRAFGARCDLARIPPSPPNFDPLFSRTYLAQWVLSGQRVFSSPSVSTCKSLKTARYMATWVLKEPTPLLRVSNERIGRPVFAQSDSAANFGLHRFHSPFEIGCSVFTQPIFEETVSISGTRRLSQRPAPSVA